MNAKSEVRNPRSERNPKPEAQPLRCAAGLAARVILPATVFRFGLRLSAFYRISGTRVSEFQIGHRLLLLLALALPSTALADSAVGYLNDGIEMFRKNRPADALRPTGRR
jgi:hypothetical protein